MAELLTRSHERKLQVLLLFSSLDPLARQPWVWGPLQSRLAGIRRSTRERSQRCERTGPVWLGGQMADVVS